MSARIWTCCDPRGCTFCVGCGEDLQKGRPLPSRPAGIGDLGSCIQVGHVGTHELRPDCLVIDSEGRCRNPEPPDPGDFDGVACSPLDLGLTGEEDAP